MPRKPEVEFDIVHAGDFRYRGGTASAIRADIQAGSAAGLRIAAMPFLGARTQFVEDFESRLAQTLKNHQIPLLHPDAEVSCKVIFAHHPNVFENLPHRPVRIAADHTVCILHHPYKDGLGRPQYDLENVVQCLEHLFCAPVRLAPVSPVCRRQLETDPFAKDLLLPLDFPNLIDTNAWPVRDKMAPYKTAVIGRHSRPDVLKWPETPEKFHAAYPADSRFEYRVLGGIRLDADMEVPDGWDVLPFRTTGVDDFLKELDFFVYYHHAHWVEAFGIAIAEALTVGVVTILPPHFEPIFGSGAVYCEPEGVRDLLQFFIDRPDEYRRQSRAGVQFVQQHLDLSNYTKRWDAVCDALEIEPVEKHARPEVRPDLAVEPSYCFIAPRKRERAVMMTGNGVGLGHVTRLLAIAGRLPDWIEPVFLTLSPATELIRKAGYAAEFLQSHKAAQVDSEGWNDAFALDVTNFINASSARNVVFDGNDAFPGLRRVIPLHRDVGWVWIRRGMWQPHHKVNHETENLFNIILDPGEIAASVDVGDTVGRRGAIQIDPILSSSPHHRMSRAQAAAALDIDPNKTSVFVQLGARSNFDTSNIVAALHQHLAQLGPEYQVINLHNPLLASERDQEQQLPSRSVYPFYPYSACVDLMICPAGYNSFHENCFGGIPALYVPNEAAEMDNQLLRAEFGRVLGIAQVLRKQGGAAAAGSVLEEALSPSFRNRVRARTGVFKESNGAGQAASIIAEFAASLRTHQRFAATVRAKIDVLDFEDGDAI